VWESQAADLSSAADSRLAAAFEEGERDGMLGVLVPFMPSPVVQARLGHGAVIILLVTILSP